MHLQENLTSIPSTPIRQFTALCNFSPRGNLTPLTSIGTCTEASDPNTLFHKLPTSSDLKVPGTHVVQIHTCKQNIHTNKNYILKKENNVVIQHNKNDKIHF